MNTCLHLDCIPEVWQKCQDLHSNSNNIMTKGFQEKKQNKLAQEIM